MHVHVHVHALWDAGVGGCYLMQLNGGRVCWRWALEGECRVGSAARLGSRCSQQVARAGGWARAAGGNGAAAWGGSRWGRHAYMQDAGVWVEAVVGCKGV